MQSLRAGCSQDRSCIAHVKTALRRKIAVEGRELYLTLSMGIALTRPWCATPTPPCTALRPPGATAGSSSTVPWRARSSIGWIWKPPCGKPSNTKNSACTTSPSSRSGMAASSGRKPWSAGSGRASAGCRPRRSSTGPGRAASSSPWATGCCERPAARRWPGTGPACTCASPSTCRWSSYASPISWTRCGMRWRCPACRRIASNWRSPRVPSSPISWARSTSCTRSRPWAWSWPWTISAPAIRRCPTWKLMPVDRQGERPPEFADKFTFLYVDGGNFFFHTILDQACPCADGDAATLP